MTTQIGASVFVDPSEITHSVINDCPTITFGPYPTVNRVDVHLRNVAGIDAVIAELVALKQEMDPPVITDSEPKCLDKYEHIGNTDYCQRPTGHAGQHAGRNNRRWDAEPAPSGMQDPAPVARVTDDGQTYSDEPARGERCLEHSDPADDLYGQCVKHGPHKMHENVHHQQWSKPFRPAPAPGPAGGPFWCPATTGPDEELDRALYCDREAGHPGSHHAPGPDEGSEVAWSDEAAAVAR